MIFGLFKISLNASTVIKYFQDREAEFTKITPKMYY